MFDNNFRYKKWVALSATIGLIAFLIYLLFYTNFESVEETIESTNAPIYLLAFVCVLVNIALNALTWQRILQGLGVKTSLRRAFDLSWVGIFVDAIIPGGWSGDLFKAYLLAKDQKGTGAKVTASVVVKNVFEIILTLVTLIMGISLLALNYRIENVVIFAIGIIMLFLTVPLVVIVYLSVNINATKKLIKVIQHLSKFINKKQDIAADAEVKIQSQIKEFHEGIMIIKTNPKCLIQPAIWQTLSWIFDIFTRLLIFMAIGYAITADKIIITSTIVVTIQTQGIAFAGFAQIVSSAIYNALGISQVISISSSLLAGFATFWLKTAIAFIPFEIIVFARCVPFFCKKCEGIGKKTCEQETISEDTISKL
jgi:uncharacterized protein (TIRG00374 family)